MSETHETYICVHCETGFVAPPGLSRPLCSTTCEIDDARARAIDIELAQRVLKKKR